MLLFLLTEISSADALALSLLFFNKPERYTRRQMQIRKCNLDYVNYSGKSFKLGKQTNKTNKPKQLIKFEMTFSTSDSYLNEKSIYG